MTFRRHATLARRNGGFSLLELLVVIALAGLLATLAYPGYRDSVVRTRRSDGIVALLALQMAQEKFRGNCPHYAQSIGDNNLCGAGANASVVRATAASQEGYYALAIAPGSATRDTYTLVATPVGTQAEDGSCAPMTLTIDAMHPNGVRAPANCW